MMMGRSPYEPEIEVASVHNEPNEQNHRDYPVCHLHSLPRGGLLSDSN